MMDSTSCESTTPAPFTGLNYWEVGNEQYGTWEIDHYSPTGVGGNATIRRIQLPRRLRPIRRILFRIRHRRQITPVHSDRHRQRGPHRRFRQQLDEKRPDLRARRWIRPRIHFRSQLHVRARPGKRYSPPQRHRIKPLQHSRLVHALRRLRKHPRRNRRLRRCGGRSHHGHRVQLQLWHRGQADDQPGQRPVRCRLHRKPSGQRIHRWIVLGSAKRLDHRRK